MDSHTQPWTHNKYYDVGEVGQVRQSSRNPCTTGPSWTRMIGEDRAETIQGHVLGIVTGEHMRGDFVENIMSSGAKESHAHETRPWTE
jgi:hypothetical protein